MLPQRTARKPPPPVVELLQSIMDKNRSQKRADALKQLIAAKKALSEGQAELARAQEKIKKATDLINKSADVLRDTWSRRRE